MYVAVLIGMLGTRGLRKLRSMTVDFTLRTWEISRASRVYYSYVLLINLQINKFMFVFVALTV